MLHTWRTCKVLRCLGCACRRYLLVRPQGPGKVVKRSHLWHAALADNLRRLGRTAEAAEELETAAALAPAEGERRLLLSRLLDVRSEPA